MGPPCISHAGHSDILGNDRADLLANKGSDSRPIGPEPFIPFSSASISSRSLYRVQGVHLSRFILSHDLDSFQHALLYRFFKSNGYKLPTLDKQELRILTHLFSGCNYLKAFQTTIGNETSRTCDKCDLESETVEHFLLRCPAFALQRYNTFGYFVNRSPRPDILCNTKLLLRFAARTKYITFYDSSVT